MLVGSGGVVALVVGAWSALWALRSLPARSDAPRGAWPVAAAFLSAMLGFALLSSFEETTLALLDVIRADPGDRAEVLAEVRWMPWQPLLAVLLGGTLLVGGILGGTTDAARREVPRQRGALAPDRVERVGSALALVLALVDLVVLGLFGAAARALEPDLGSIVRGAAVLQAYTTWGVALSVALVLVGTVVGCWRWRRERARAR